MSRILCCVDDSPETKSVAGVAMSLASKFQLELVLVHVSPHSHAPGISAAIAGRERLLEEERDGAQAIIDRVVEETGAQARTRTELGSAAEKIVELCREEDAAFVVLGSRGRGGLKASVLGSTSLHVAGHAPCPCVIVPHGVEHVV